MTLQEIQDREEIRELAETFANLSDTREADKLAGLFPEDGVLEFQMGEDSQVQEIRGREALEKAFRATLEPMDKLYHLSGQQTLSSYQETEADGCAYCQATLVQNRDGKPVATVNSIRYEDHYVKADGRWLLGKRRSVFILSETREIKG